MKKALALILTLIMVLGLMPAAMAATAEEGEVTITKSLVSNTPDEDGNYTIKLTVQGNPITQSAQPNADVVLVVDCSGSMAPEEDLTYEYEECGSEEFEAINFFGHHYICKKCGDWYDEKPTKCTNEVLQSTSGVDRMSIAKQASKIFAEGILTNGSGNKMAVIGFAGSSGGVNGENAIKVSQGLTDKLNEIKDKIDKMSAKGGTNYTAALKKAYDILYGRQDKNRPGYVIFISDGAPGYSGDSPNDTNWNGQNQVADLKNAGITIYTIGIDLDTNPANYLKDMATDEAHFKNLSDQDLSVQLAKLLAEWAGKINRVPAGTNAFMTDVINSEYFEYVSSDEGLTYNGETHSLTWNIGDIPETTQSVTFKVKPKGDWTGTENTNVSCTLTYTKPDNTEGSATAPSPTVTIAATTGKIVVTKIVVMPEGDSASVNGKEYSFTITQEDGRDIYTKTVTIGDNNTGSVTFENVPFGNYTVTESDAGMQGYAVTTTSAPANGTVTVSDTADGNITFTNTYTKNTVEANGSLTIAKEFGSDSAFNTENWANATGSKQLTFTIVKEGETNGTNVTLPTNDTTNPWTYTVNNLSVGEYTVTESDAEVEGYNLTVTDGNQRTVTVTGDKASTITFTNTYTPETIITYPVQIKKEASGLPEGTTYPNVTVDIMKGNEKIETINDLVPNGNAQIVYLPAGEYTVEERRETAGVDGYILDVTNAKLTVTAPVVAERSTAPDAVETVATATITNTYTKMEDNTGSLTVKKTVSGGGASYNKEFTFTVTMTENNDPQNGEVTYGGVTFTNGVATFTLKHNQEKSITGIPAGYTYTVTENADGYTQSITSGSATGTIVKGKTATVTFNNYKSGGDHYYPTPDPVPPIVIPPNTGDMTIWQSILHFLGIR